MTESFVELSYSYKLVKCSLPVCLCVDSFGYFRLFSRFQLFLKTIYAILYFSYLLHCCMWSIFDICKFCLFYDILAISDIVLLVHFCLILGQSSIFGFITARAYARAVLGVVILSVRQSVRPSVRLSVRPSVCLSVCLSDTRVDCDKTKWRTAGIFIPHERAITLLLWYQECLVGDAPFPLKSAFKVTHPLRKTPTSTDFRS